MIIEKNKFEKKSRIFFDEKKFNIFFGILQIATLVKIFKKKHFFKKNDEKNQNFKNSNDRSMKHPMGWVRAKYQLQHSSDGFSKSTPVILPKTFNLLRKSQKSNVNQHRSKKSPGSTWRSRQSFVGPDIWHEPSPLDASWTYRRNF